MRRPSADYLEEAKIEELAADLEARGYRVAREVPLGDQRIDLLAERDGERRAYAVKAISRLKDSSHDIERLHKTAREAGLTGFIMVVAVPPRKIDVTIDNLRTELLDYFVEHDVAANLNGPYPVTKMERVVDVLIDAIDVHPSRMHVRGRAYLDVQIDDGLGFDGEVDFAVDSYPFTFDLDLDPDLKVVAMHELSIDPDPYAKALVIAESRGASE